MMNEEKAKKILQFLAKKLGYDGLKFYNVHIAVVKYDKDSKMYYNKSCLYVGKRNLLYKLYKLPDNAKSYANVLDDMLKLSRKGYHIETYRYDQIFMPAYATIETLEIEADLAENVG